ncbi:FKH1-like protein [Purpureocillium lavendulum]|uniref:FKH1-like protein n=1 Tax=Purpureocillium lavendulum TaxID=1247861 RepID=A0AB34FML8_9HYPO|nr:FKH1-like protein [Purpureocillium lavendulum]
MVLPPCRAGLARSRLALRSLQTSLRAGYATESTTTTTTPSSSSSSTSSSSSARTTPESFKIPDTLSDTSAAAAGASTSSTGTTTGAPRWSQTPAGMKAPLQMDFAKSSRNKAWTVNSSPERLDDMYERLLGPGGSKMLPEELKWLAVTHKSFDQGRRGFNDRLALMGACLLFHPPSLCYFSLSLFSLSATVSSMPPPPRLRRCVAPLEMIAKLTDLFSAGRLTLIMEATKDIVSRPPSQAASTVAATDPYGREPFAHEALAGVDNLSGTTPREAVGKERLHALASSVGMLDVVRWKPRLPRRLEASGVETVLGGALMAVVGAVTLQHGGKVAAKVVRERILARLPKEE